jgi:hypothetical protein
LLATVLLPARTALWLVAVILLPGRAICYFVRAGFSRPSETLFFSIGVGTAIQPILGFILDATVGISGITLDASYALLTIVFFVGGTMRRVSRPLHLRSVLQQFVRTVRSAGSSLKSLARWTSGLGMAAALSVLAIAIANWSSGIGTHSVDIGWHIYWTRTIILSGHLPNYYTLEPFDQPSRFTMGAHFLMAGFEMIAGLPIIDYSWIPLVLCSTFSLLGGYVIAVALTKSRILGWVAAALIAGGLLPGGFIQRGNFPDIVGFFIAMFLFWVLADANELDWHAVVFVLGTVALLNYHQLAFVVLAVGVLVWLALMAIFQGPELRGRLVANFMGWRPAAFWTVAIIAFIWAARQTTYLNPSGASLLASGYWVAYVPTVGDYEHNLGTVLLFLGFLGYLAVILRREPTDLVVGSWILALLFLSQSPLLGLQFEPTRFMMRTTEPLSIAAAFGIAYFGKVAAAAFVHREERKGLMGTLLPRLRSWIGRNRHPNRSGPASDSILLAGILVGMFVVGSVAIQPPRYQTNEPLFPTDRILATWLAANADPTKYIIVNVDVESTGTWIQALSMKPHFLYKVDFAASVSAPPYRQVYLDLVSLYARPNASGVPAILQRYNVGYVVVNESLVGAFAGSPFFREAFNAGPSRIFVPVLA